MHKSFQIQLISEHAGIIDGFCIWFDLKLDECNTISTNPSTKSCWNQAVVRLEQRQPIKEHETIDISVSCKNGSLKVTHTFQTHQKLYFVEESIIHFINDFEFLNQLETDVFKHLNKSSTPVDLQLITILDFCTFPHIGLMSLILNRVREAYFAQSSRKLVDLIVETNALDRQKIKFISNPIDLLLENPDVKFDIVIVCPFEGNGKVLNESVQVFPHIRTMLKPTGVLVPYDIEIVAKLVSSDFLSNVTKVTNKQIDSLQIPRAINDFSTENHLDISCFYDMKKLYNAFGNKVATAKLQLNSKHFESITNIENESLLQFAPNAILYWYKIQFIEGHEYISSYHKFSHISLAAFMADDADDAKRAKHCYRIRYKQNYGLFKLDLLND